VLHFGFKTSPDDAQTQFATTLDFSRRYPSRVLVLCPAEQASDATATIRAKVYGECFLGKTKGDTRCVEFVLLHYPMAARCFLEDLVSTCLSTDLPLYYWAHAFSSSARLNDYQYLLRTSKRVIIDSAVVPPDALSFDWPHPENVRDLALARLLPVRQGLGQFLSGISPDELVRGLRSGRVVHDQALAAEAVALERWLRERLIRCGANRDEVHLAREATTADSTLALHLSYEDSRRFDWRVNLADQHADFVSCLGGEERRLSARMTLLEPAAALAEAVFF
jgi:glucose-6-phosphate dehydrogenase assembly protein OpcA